MIYSQRDIVKVKTPFTGVVDTTHPFVIISCERCNSHDPSGRRYTGVMLTHSKQRDKFSFPITKECIETSWNEDISQVRTHIIASFTDKDLSRDMTVHVGKMKKADFKELIQQIKDFILSVD